MSGFGTYCEAATDRKKIIDDMTAKSMAEFDAYYAAVFMAVNNAEMPLRKFDSIRERMASSYDAAVLKYGMDAVVTSFFMRYSEFFCEAGWYSDSAGSYGSKNMWNGKACVFCERAFDVQRDVAVMQDFDTSIYYSPGYDRTEMLNDIIKEKPYPAKDFSDCTNFLEKSR